MPEGNPIHHQEDLNILTGHLTVNNPCEQYKSFCFKLDSLIFSLILSPGDWAQLATLQFTGQQVCTVWFWWLGTTCNFTVYRATSLHCLVLVTGHNLQLYSLQGNKSALFGSGDWAQLATLQFTGQQVCTVWFWWLGTTHNTDRTTSLHCLVLAQLITQTGQQVCTVLFWWLGTTHNTDRATSLHCSVLVTGHNL